jgi:benzoyl-CoA reductase/2-hydroxyglutaryl-CoA dehydratase subunit BcrC/BadD/HgdB
VRLRAPGIDGTEIADIYLSGVICSYTRSLLEFAMDDRYDFLGGWVFAASCDHIRRLYDNLDYIAKPSFNHIIDVPHRFGENQLAWYTDELGILTDKLASQFNVSFTRASLSEAIENHNAFCDLLSSIGGSRKSRYPLISGTEFHALMLISQITPKYLSGEMIRRFKTSLSEREGISDYRARLVLAGGQLDDPGFIEIIESTGGLVVADHLCTGSVPGLDRIRLDCSADGEFSEDPIQGIARHYLKKTACPRMMESFDARVEAILASVDACQADGVVIEFVKFCDTWGIEAGLMASTIRKKGVPAICLEREYRLSGEGQLRTRIQAFIESMGL